MVMVIIAHLVVIMADCNSDSCHSLANDASDRHAVLYRPEIHPVLAEVSIFVLCVEN